MAAGYLLIGRRLRVKLSLVPYIFVVYGMAALLLVIMMFAAGQSPFGYQPVTYLWLLALALIPQLVGHSTLNWALRYLPASFVSIALLGEPIASTVLAYFLLKETPGPLKVVGAALILAGIYAASLGQDEKEVVE
jgi:drug/metabolite transporter (DMT)-like permease